MITYIYAFCCVLGMVAGQVLFKYGANELTRTGTLFDIKVSFLLFSAIGIYGLTSVAWVLILQRAELGRIYPFMALAFVLVPIQSLPLWRAFHSNVSVWRDTNSVGDLHNC